jgi:hypothetical protein
LKTMLEKSGNVRRIRINREIIFARVRSNS